MADRASSVYAPEGGVDGYDSRPGPKRRRVGRAICQFLLILDIGAAVAFIIVGLAGCSWVNFFVQNDPSSQPYDLITSYANFSRIQGLFYTCVYSDTWNKLLPNNQSFFGLAFGLPPNTASGTNPGNPAFWQIVNLRWWQVVLHCIAGGIACIVVLVNLFLIIPACRRRVHHAEENMSYFGAFFLAIATALQLICMILFHIRYAAENASDTTASVWIDIWGNLISSVRSQTVMTYGVDYALGWCAFACLSYATIIYLARDHTCNVLGEPVIDPYLGGTADEYVESSKKMDEGPMDEVFGPQPGLYGNPALYGQAYGPTYGTYGPASGRSAAPSYYGPATVGLKPAQQYQFGQVGGGGHVSGASLAGTQRTLPFQLGRPADANVQMYSTGAPVGAQINPAFQAGFGGAGPSGSVTAGIY
jgi:hypothetical protein